MSAHRSIGIAADQVESKVSRVTRVVGGVGGGWKNWWRGGRCSRDVTRKEGGRGGGWGAGTVIQYFDCAVIPSPQLPPSRVSLFFFPSPNISQRGR